MEKTNLKGINAEHTPQGFLVLSTIFDGRLITKKYQGFRLRDAKTKFINELKNQ